MPNRLWGYEGEIGISQLSSSFFLIEFPSVRLCNWVMDKAWHIHHSPLLLRKWYHGIELVEMMEEENPIWITLDDVPPQLISPKGISWITSQLGMPVSKFVREGISVKVCLMCKDDAIKPSKLNLVMGELG
ncbi:hypothetical protein LINPERPRIM_LOCUS38137 [Linum perenne]